MWIKDGQPIALTEHIGCSDLVFICAARDSSMVVVMLPKTQKMTRTIDYFLSNVPFDVVRVDAAFFYLGNSIYL